MSHISKIVCICIQCVMAPTSYPNKGVSTVRYIISVSKITYSKNWWEQLLLWSNDKNMIQQFHFILHMHQQLWRFAAPRNNEILDLSSLDMNKTAFGLHHSQILNMSLIDDLENTHLYFFPYEHFFAQCLIWYSVHMTLSFRSLPTAW